MASTKIFLVSGRTKSLIAAWIWQIARCTALAEPNDSAMPESTASITARTLSHAHTHAFVRGSERGLYALREIDRAVCASANSEVEPLRAARRGYTVASGRCWCVRASAVIVISPM